MVRPKNRFESDGAVFGCEGGGDYDRTTHRLKKNAAGLGAVHNSQKGKAAEGNSPKKRNKKGKKRCRTVEAKKKNCKGAGGKKILSVLSSETDSLNKKLPSGEKIAEREEQRAGRRNHPLRCKG